MKNEYRILAARLPSLQAEIDKLNKRARKLGCAPIVLNNTGRTEDVQVKNQYTGIVTHTHRFIFIEVIGETPKYAGWELVACVEHTEEGNILRKVPGCKVELNEFREGAQHCDHCKTIRRRSETFIMLHEDGSRKMIGRNCIKDFLGHKDPHALASAAELLFAAGELCGAEEGDYFEGAGFRGHELFFVSGFLAFAACAIRHLGYVSAARSKESQEMGGNICSTKQTAVAWMHPFKDAKLGKDYFLPEDCDKEAADKAKQHVLDTLGAKAPEELSDFEHSLLVVCKCEAVEPKNAGILAFVPEYYARSIERAKVAANEAYFGEVGKRVRNVPLTYLKSTGWDSQYGWTYMHSFTGPAGERIQWKSGSNVEATAGAVLQATFTVKAHEEYKGHKQTRVSRIVFADAPEATPAKDQWGNPL